jgi:hypothetical protein
MGCVRECAAKKAAVDEINAVSSSGSYKGVSPARGRRPNAVLK